jgi:hypothetical protein
LTMLPNGYCLKCRASRPVHNPQSFESKDGRSAQRGNCPVCQSEMVTFEPVLDEKDWGDLIDYDYVTSIPAYCPNCGTSQDTVVARAMSRCLVCGETLVRGSKSSKLSKAVVEASPVLSALFWAFLGLVLATIFVLITPAGSRTISLVSGLIMGILYGGLVIRDPGVAFIQAIIFAVIAGLAGNATLAAWSTVSPDNGTSAPVALVGIVVGGVTGVFVATMLKPKQR